MNVTWLVFNFADFVFVTLLQYTAKNVRVVLNFAETVHPQNKSHAKFKAFTVREAAQDQNI